MSQEFDQAVIWTALPQGFVPGSEEKQAQVSVFVTPQLSVKSSNGTPPHLSTYTDWVNWPETMRRSPSGPVKFKLNITAVGANLTGGTPVSISAEPDLTVLNPKLWTAMFPAATTRVDPYEVENFNSVPIRSYHTGKVHSYVESLYGPVNAAPSTPLNFAPIRTSIAAGSGGVWSPVTRCPWRPRVHSSPRTQT